MFFGALFGVVGFLLLSWACVQVATQPWDLAEVGVETWGRAAEKTPFTGDRYVIEVEGKSYSCYRGRKKYPATEAPILYDPADPSRCRGADAVDGLSEYERTGFAFGLSALLFGLAWVLAHFAEPRDVWAREDPPGLLRPRLMWAARVLLGSAVVAGVFMMNVFAGRTFGPDPSRRDVPEPAEPPGSEAEPALGEVQTAPIQEVSAVEMQAEDWPVSRAKVRKLPVRGPSVWVGDPEPIGAAIVVSTGPAYHGRGSEHVLLDVAKSKVLARFDDEGITSAAAGVVITRVGEKRVVVHADDGLVVAPEIRLPPPHRVENVRIVASQLEPVVWVFAQSNERATVFHGQWVDPRTPAIELRDTIGFWPELASGESGVEVWDPDGASEGCWRARMRPDQPPECIAEGEGTFAALALHATPEGPFTVGGPFEATIVDRRTSTHYPVVPGCAATELARLAVPARVFGACLDGETGDVPFALWSPERTWTFTGPFVVNGSIGRGPQRGPVTAIEPYGDSAAPIERWVDLERGRLVRTPALVPLVWGGSFGFQRKVLAQPMDQLESLWLLDLEAGTLERIASDIGCPHALVQTDLHGSRATIGCNSAMGASGEGQRLRGYTWTEVIDFERKTRWRTTAAFEPRLTEDGLVVGVTRSRPAQLVAIVETAGHRTR